MSRWVKGGPSPNPGGRPRTERARADVRAAIAKGLPAVVEKLQALALAGDTNAARLLLERALPALKAVAPDVTLPGYAPTMSNTDAARAVFAAVAAGQLPPDIGAQLIAALGAAARVQETDELARRIAAIEQATGGMA